MDTACTKKKTRPKTKKQSHKDKEAMRLKDVYPRHLERYETTGTGHHKTDTSAAKKEYDLRVKYLKHQTLSHHTNRVENKSKAIWQVMESEKKSKNMSYN